jgi:hypothetical protein
MEVNVDCPPRLLDGKACQADVPARQTPHERAMSRKVTVRVISSVSDVEEIRGIWAGWRQHPNSDIDFYLNTVRSRPEFLRPHVMVVFRGPRPEALLVGRLELRKVEANLGYAGLLLKETRALTFLYGGLLGTLSPEGSEALVRNIMSSLSQGDADLAYFNHLRVDSLLYRAAIEVPGRLSRDHYPKLQIHRSMSVPDTIEEFYQHLSAKVRKNLKWQAKKLVQEYSNGVGVRCFRDAESLDELIGDVEGIARKTYQRGLGVGFTDNPQTRRRLSLEAEKGWLHGYVLYVHNVPCAFWLGTVYLRTFHSDFMGYDPSFGKHSPGMFLIVKVIEDFCNFNNKRDRIAKIDFGLGDAQYKEVLGDLEWNDASLYVFSPKLRGVSLNLMRAPAAMLERTARRALEKSGLLDRVKKMWRLKSTAN